MSTLNIYWNEADKTWDLIRLYQDLGRTKGRNLTELQKAKLRGALCNVSLKDVAEQLNRGLKGLRTDLSTGLYRFVQELLWNQGIEHEGKVYWQQIPRLLAQAGYNRQSVSPTQEILDTISAKPLGKDTPKASAIIETIENQLISNRINGSEAQFPLAVAKKLEIDGDQAAKRKEFDTAIHYYRIPVEQDLSYSPFLIKIAACFDKLHQYSDSVAIALEFLPLFTNQDHVSQLNGVLGSAFHELATYTRDELVLRQALSYYKKAFIRSEGPNVLSLWNSFELLEKFSQIKQADSDKYLRKAKLAFCDFKDIAHDPRSNFQRYRQSILEDAQRIQAEIGDPWLLDELSGLQDL